MKLNRLTLSAAVAAASILPSAALAQDNFPDVPANHWAYQAVAQLKSAGLLVGYPDGLFRGSRPLSRYEMAVAFNSAYAKLKALLDGMQAQLDASKSSLLKKEDLDPVKDQLARLQDQIDQMKAYGPEIADLKRASDTFELELERLGVNVEAMKKTLGDLDSRITRLEKKKPSIDIHGDVDFWMGAGNSRDDSYGLSKDARILGFGGTGPVASLFPPVAGAVGLEHDTNILHEAAFTIAGNNIKGPQWTTTIVLSDMLGNFNANSPGVAFGNQSDIFSSISPNAPVNSLIGYQTGNEDLYIQDAKVSWGGPKANVQVGRMGLSLNPYMYQRIDNTSYFSNDRWDDGKYYFDGMEASAQLGPAKLMVFGGNNSGVKSVNGVEINPVRSGPIGGFLSSDPTVASGVLNFDRSEGADLRLGSERCASLDLGYIVLQSNTPTPIDLVDMANHVSVYGADGQAHLGSFNLQAGYHKSDIQNDTTTVEGKDNSASNVKLSFGRPAFNLFAEYRQIEANYVAPGDWGRLGVLRNPTNIKGGQFGAYLKFLKHFSLDAHGNIESGLSNNYSASTFLGTATGIRGYDVRLNYDATHAFNLFAEYESTSIGNLAAPASYAGSGNPSYRWATFGLGYHVNPNMLFNLQYELDDINNDYQVSGGGNFHGGFLTSQVTVKF